LVSQVFDDELNQIFEYNDLVMIQIAGPNGSGKTTFYRKFLRPLLDAAGMELEYVNADEVALDMPATGNAPIGMDPAVAEYARKEADFQRELLLKEGHKQSVIFETVFSDTQGHRLEYLQRAKEAGYKVVMIFIALESVELSIERVRIRVADRGHDVPEHKQRARYQRSLDNGKKATDIADLSLFMDNSAAHSGEGVTHQPVAVLLGSDILESICPAPGWFLSLFLND
jgi:predicted ABC-type ATPase